MTVARSSFIEGEVIENRQWTDGLYSLKIRVAQLPFKSGQFIRLQLPVNEEVLAKSYSLINAPDESDVEVFYNVVPEGKLSNALAALKSGDSVSVSQPAFGFFVLDEIPESKYLWMIATGTGLGPYISMLKTEKIWQRFDKVVLVHGVPFAAELAYSTFLKTLQAQQPEKFTYLSSVTREPNPNGLEQRVTDSLADGSLEALAGQTIHKDDSHVMLCGSHNMIKDMKVLLAEQDMHRHLRHKPGHVTTEQYF